MPPNRDERAGAGQRTPSPSGAHGWRAGLALGRRWAVRAVAGYAALFVLLIVGSLILRPHQDWSAVGGRGRSR